MNQIIQIKVLQVNMLLLILLQVLSITSTASADGCAISTNGDLGEPQPLIVNRNYTIRHPQARDIVSFSTNESVILSCPGSALQINVGGQQYNLTEHETATCDAGKQFVVNNTRVFFTNITCRQYPFHIARVTNLTCENNKQEIEIGFLVHSAYVRHLRICFDNIQHATLYSHFELLPNIRGRQSGFPRPSWINGNFYNFGGNFSNKDANALLIRANQIATLSRLIGYNSTTTNPYINYTSDLYLSRGHLTAKADFVFGAQQRLTFHMVNAMPQWMTFNGRNWADAEADARNLASNYNLTLQTYTGTYGVMSLPHVATNQDVKIYMYNDENGNQEFPVPLLFWKLLYQPETQAGIVIIGVNHPYIRNLSEAIICEDIYDSINWTTTFTRNNIIDGYMYACSPIDFRKTVTYMPNLNVTALLTFNSTYNTTQPGSTGRILAGSFTSLVMFTIVILNVTW